jgi:pilus assembly protein Flp/PilA
MLKKLLSDNSGATAVEYGIISAIMAVALLSGFGAFSNALNTQFQFLSNKINY